MSGNNNLSVSLTSRWKSEQSLFPPLSVEIMDILELFPEILQKVWPLKNSHKRSLPEDIYELSHILTKERSSIKHSYWMRPAFISAYLYYFLPWNLIRLTRFLLGLPLEIPEGSPVLLDAGSGPLTLPISLWLANRRLRKHQLNVFAIDTGIKPLELGVKIFRELCKYLNEPCWGIKTSSSPIKSLASSFFKAYPHAQPWIISAVNILNECRTFSRKARKSNGEESFNTEEEYFTELLEAWEPLTRNNEFKGFLFIEPGTRLGGDTIMELRKVAIGEGFYPAYPCTHTSSCPLHKKGKKNSSLSNSWCHFTFSATDAPGWLKELSKAAGLEKKSLSLSPLFLTLEPEKSQKTHFIPVRIISQAFPVPDISEKCRYGCFIDGLGLLGNCANLLSGTLAYANKPDKVQIDRHSGAYILLPYSQRFKR